MFKKRKNKILFAIIIQYISAAIFTVIMALYQGNFKFLSMVNGMQISGALLVILGWFVFVNHHGVFDVITYGVKAFFNSLFGKTMEKTLFDVRMERKKMPVYLFVSLWINGTIIIGISFLIYYNYLP